MICSVGQLTEWLPLVLTYAGLITDVVFCSVKFVDVMHSGGYVPYPRSDDCEVTFWTLTMEDGKMDWKLEFSITDKELPISPMVPSPHEPPAYPFLSMDNPDVAYFFVAELGCRVKKVWLVSVDLINRAVKDALPYLKGQEDLSGDDVDWATKKRFCFEPLLLSEITHYFLEKVMACCDIFLFY